MENKASHNPTTSMIIFFICFALISSVGVIYCIFKIQKIDASEWEERSLKREADLRTIEAQRGNIISSDGKILATTSPVCDLYLDLASIKLDTLAKTKHIFDSTLPIVCQILDKIDTAHTAKHYYDIIRNEYNKAKPSGCKLIKRKIPYVDWITIKKTAGWNRIVLNSIFTTNEKNEISENSVIRKNRAHIYGNLGENIIGFQNSLTSQTYTGLEGHYDSVLRGHDGSYIFRRLTRGVWIPTENRNYYNDSNTIILEPTVNGQDIVSTIDTRYQDVAENALRKSLTTNGAESGCAILMETATGYILACANLSFDSSTNSYKENADMNIACSFRYEPGSTFKTVIMAAMLEDTSINLDTAKHVIIGKKTFPCPHGNISDGVHAQIDTVSIPVVMAKSSNVGMCELGWEYYSNRRNILKEKVESIFPYDLVDYDIKTLKAKSHINDLNRSGRDFLNFCYGYSTDITAMQLATFYNALANNGTMVKPLFCRQKGDTPIEPVILREKICSEKTISIITDMLVGVVDNGTGKRHVKSDSYKIAGKTGTASYNYDQSMRGIQNSSFAGYFPAYNPKYTCVVVVRRTRANGAPAAGTVFKKLADCVMAIDTTAVNSTLNTIQGNPNSYPYTMRGKQSEIMQASEILGIPFHSSDSTAEWCSYEVRDNRPGRYNKIIQQHGRVPNCKGMSAKDAILLLEQHGYKADISGYGKVKSQEPKSGTATKGNTTVHLILAN